MSANAFSTIELLITVAIMSALATAAFVQYDSVGNASRLNSESLVVVGALRDMQNKALSPRRPSNVPEAEADLTEGGNRVCGYIMFAGEVDDSQTLPYYAVYGSSDQCERKQEIVDGCESDDIGGACESISVNITNTPVKEERFTYSSISLDESVFIQSPFAYTSIRNSENNAEFIVNHRTDDSLERTITISEGGFITGQN